MIKLTSFTIQTSSEVQLIKITDQLKNFVRESGVENGFAAVITAHTTTGIMVNEGLDCLEIDIQETLEKLIPDRSDYAHSHFLPSYGQIGDNATGHLKSMLVGNSCLQIIKDGELLLGSAQDIYFAEFDGQQLRTVLMQIIGE